jgi:hypothetical protein
MDNVARITQQTVFEVSGEDGNERYKNAWRLVEQLKLKGSDVQFVSPSHGVYQAVVTTVIFEK